MDEAMIVAGIGSRKGVSADEVLAALGTALSEHGLAREDVSALATTDFKREEAGIFLAAERLSLPVIVVETPEDARLSSKDWRPSSPPGTGGEVSRATSARDGEGGVLPAEKPPLRFAALTTSPPVPEGEDGRQVVTRSASSQQVAGTPSVSETAAILAVGHGGKLLGPRIAVGRVTCAIAVGEDRP